MFSCFLTYLECFLCQEWLYIVLGKPSKTVIGVVKIECLGIVEVSKIKKIVFGIQMYSLTGFFTILSRF